MTLAAKRLGLFALALGVLALLLYLCVLFGVPRILLSRLLSSELQMPVRLAQNPQISANFSRLQINLQGLRIGQNLLRVQQIQAAWPWSALWQRRWMELRLQVTGLHLRGPWPSTPHRQSKGFAITLPQNFVLRDGSVDWPLGARELQVSALQAEYRAGQEATIGGQLRYDGQAFSVSGNYRAARPGQAGSVSMEARSKEGLLDLNVPSLHLSSANTVLIPRGDARLVWKQFHGGLDFQGLRYAAAQQSLTLVRWRLSAQPQLGGEGTLALFWKHALTVQSNFRLHAEQFLPWLHLLGLKPALADPQRALQPAALSGDLHWTSGGLVQLDQVRGTLGSAQFQGAISRADPQLPWQIHADISRLDLTPWLRSSAKTTPSAKIIPPLPKDWPALRGTLRIGELRWGQWQAKKLQIQLQAVQK